MFSEDLRTTVRTIQGQPRSAQSSRDANMAHRNPSPPRLSAEEIELIEYDNIGETVFSKKWVLRTLMKLVQSLQTTEDSEDGENSELAEPREEENSHELNDAFERELCELWDMSMNAVSNRKKKLRVLEVSSQND